MPIDALGSSAANSVIGDYSVGASAEAKKEATTLASQKELTEAEKEALFIKKMNEGQKTGRAAPKEDNSKLNKDDFMKLLLATLKYQDPTQPMDTAQLLQQTSTMTNMEQMIQMTEASKRSFEAQQRAQGTTMVGKTAVYDAIDAQGNAITTAGTIDAVEFLAEGKILVHIGKQKISMDDILGIADTTEDPKLSAEVDKAVGKAEDKTSQTGTGSSAETPQNNTATPNPKTSETDTQAA